jgi:SagB-type dehydrogenase family enzyme
MSETYGDDFQRRSRYERERMGGGGLDWSARPEPFKLYPDAPTVALPRAAPSKRRTLHEILKSRRSVREYAREALSMADLSYLLWASTGVQRMEHGYAFRTAPSAGALYPIETYLVANRVSDLPAGVYHYRIPSHELESLKEGDFGAETAAAALGQGMCASAAAVFVWTAIFERSRWKYRQRAYRYIYLDAGHIAENLALAAVECGLGTCQIGALFDGEVNAIVGVDGESESVVYMSVVGRARQ